MTNTINNVPRELIQLAAELLGQASQYSGDSEAYAAADLNALLSAPSPAGVDGLGVKRYWHNPTLGFCELDPKYFDDEPGYVAFGDHQAIIDGLRGEVDRLSLPYTKMCEQLWAAQQQRDQLAGLLREFAVGISKREMPTEQELNGWFDRIDAALAELPK